MSMCVSSDSSPFFLPSSKWIGYSELSIGVNACMLDCGLVYSCLVYSVTGIGFGFYHDPDQDKELTEVIFYTFC